MVSKAVDKSRRKRNLALRALSVQVNAGCEVFCVKSVGKCHLKNNLLSKESANVGHEYFLKCFMDFHVSC